MINKKKIEEKKAGLEEFNLEMRPDVSAKAIHAKPGCVLRFVFTSL